MSWDDLNQAGPCGHVFASAAYLDLIEQTYRGHVVETIVEGEGGRTTAAARLLVRRSPFVQRAVVPPFTLYSAVLLNRMPTEAETHARTANLEKLLAGLEDRFDGIDLSLPPKIIDVRTFSWRKWAVRPLYTYRISLGEVSDPKSIWSQSTRRIARKESDNFEFVDPGPDIVSRLSVQSYRKHRRMAPLSHDRLSTLVSKAQEAAGARLYGVRNISTGEFESAVAVLRHGTVAYYWVAGGVAGPGMTVLLSQLFDQLVDEGIETFDFVGANTDSIAEFKRSFGGRLTIYFRAVWRKGPLIAAEDTLHALR